ncbi:HAD-IB family phosphatase [Sorangium sp. So ce381]|uniref:HAD-IB family phosphatase n=1 Tax=Sorangium sp. So ce381 TaxID=3133307 RepID=UPI003F5C9DA9
MARAGQGSAAVASGAAACKSAVVLILCDFDGTITRDDLTNRVWDAHLRYDWRQVLLAPAVGGELTPFELLRRGYADVDRPAAELLAELRPHAGLRSGFEDLLALCAHRAWVFHVISHGLPFYIREFLPPGTAFSCFDAVFDGRWRVTVPEAVPLGPGEDFKIRVLDQLKAATGETSTVYIGDGRLDYPAARCCDHVFAVRDSALDVLCARDGIPYTPFDSFAEICAALEGGGTPDGERARRAAGATPTAG